MIPRRLPPRPRIDKSALAIPVTQRTRFDRHLAWVRTLPCCVPGCRATDVQAHHLTCSPDPKARGSKASDRYTLPICADHRRALHERGDERAFWNDLGINAVALAAHPWNTSGQEMP
jgi:hypothetical protein